MAHPSRAGRGWFAPGPAPANRRKSGIFNRLLVVPCDKGLAQVDYFANLGVHSWEEPSAWNYGTVPYSWDNAYIGGWVNHPGERQDLYLSSYQTINRVGISWTTNSTDSVGLLAINHGGHLVVRENLYMGLNRHSSLFIHGTLDVYGTLYLAGSTGSAHVPLIDGTLRARYISGGSGAKNFEWWNGEIRNLPGQDMTVNASAGTFSVSTSGAKNIRTESGRTTNWYANIAGSTAVSKTDLGTLNIYSNNSGLTGDFKKYSGTLRAGSSGSYAFGRGRLILYNGGTVASTSSSSRTIGNSQVLIYDNTSFGQTSGGTGSLTFTGQILLGASPFLTINRTTTFQGGVGETSSLARALHKTGAGMLVLSGSGTYRGDTIVSAGALRLGNHNRVNDVSDLIVRGGTFDLQSYNETVKTVTLSSGSIIGSGTLTAGSYSVSSGSIGAKLGGSGKHLTKSGSGSVTLSGANTYTGTTDIQQGTLQLSGGGRLSDATDVTVAGTFDLNGVSDTIDALDGGGIVRLGGGTLTVGGNNGGAAFAGTIEESGSFTKTGTGTQTLSGSNTYTGTTTVNAGNLRLGAHNTLHDSSNLAVNGGTFDLQGYSDTVDLVQLLGGTLAGSGTLTGSSYDVRKGTIIARLGGPASLTKSTADIVTLSGSNTYTGATNITEGTLRLSGGGRLSDSTDVTADGTFDLNGVSDTIDALDGDGEVLLGGGILTLGANDGSGSFTGKIKEEGSLVKVGTGTQSVTIGDQFAGSILAEGGTLVLQSSTVVLNGASLFASAGSRVEYANTTVQDGQLTQNGGGRHVVTGESVLESTTIAGGTTLETAAMTTLQDAAIQGTVVNNDGPGEAAVMTIIGGSNSGRLDVHGTTTMQPDAGGVPWINAGTVNVTGTEAALIGKQHGVVDQGAKVTVTGPGALWTNNLADDDSLLSIYVAGNATGPGTSGTIELANRAGLVVGEKLTIWGEASAVGKVTLDNRSRLISPLTEVIGASATLELRNSSAIYGDVYSGEGVIYIKDGTSRIFGSVTGGSTITVDGGTLIVGEDGNVSDFDFEGNVIVENGGVLDIRDKDLAYLGTNTTLSNGAIVSQNGFSVDGSDEIEGFGVIVGDVHGDNAQAGLLIDTPTGTVNLSGTLEIGSATAVVYSQAEAELGEATTMGGGTIIADHGLRIGEGETLSGTGTIEATVTNKGRIVIDHNAEAGLTIAGDYRQDEEAALVFEISGPDDGSAGYLLNIAGAGTLSGEIVFRFTNGYAPREGEQFSCTIQMSGDSRVDADFGVENLMPGFDFDAGWDAESQSLTLTAKNEGHFVPEPSVLSALMTMGLIGLLGRATRRAYR